MNRQYGALSGVAIVLIVLNHSIHFGLQVSPVSWPWVAPLIVVQALGAFAVPTFLFVSGAFVAYAAGSLSVSFLKSSLERIVAPYLCWSALYYLVEFVVGGVRHSPWAHLKNLLVGYPYHFVPLLLFWYLLAPLLVRAGRRYGLWILTAIATYQILLIDLRFPGIFGAAVILPNWAHRIEAPILFSTMADWAIYFPLGLIVTMHQAKVRGRLARFRWLAVGATAALFLLGILNAFKLATAPWARLAAPLPLMLALPMIQRGSIPLVALFEFVGRRSYGIYLAHFVVVTVVAALLPRSGLAGPGAGPIVFPTFAMLALGIPLLLMDALARIRATRNVYRYLFGIVPPAR